MPVGDQARTLLTSALRDPRHLSRYRGRWGALVKRDWTGYIAELDGQPSGI